MEEVHKRNFQNSGLARLIQIGQLKHQQQNVKGIDNASAFIGKRKQ